MLRLGLEPSVTRRVYELAPSSRQVSLKERDFLFALAPEDRPGLLDETLYFFVRDALPGASLEDLWKRLTVADVTSASVAAIT